MPLSVLRHGGIDLPRLPFAALEMVPCYLPHDRKAMVEVGVQPQLTGTVEVDETFVGGKYDKRRKRGPWDKQPVIGLLQRNGKFEARTIPSTGARVLVGIVKDRVSKDAKIMTDELAAYRRLNKVYSHERICHSKEEWSRGDVHTNGIESAWSLFKRSLIGSYHQISVKHMDAYLDEFEWRFNNRENKFLFRDTLIKLLSSPKIEFKKLTA
jgi:transposase-like protein